MSYYSNLWKWQCWIRFRDLICNVPKMILLELQLRLRVSLRRVWSFRLKKIVDGKFRSSVHHYPSNLEGHFSSVMIFTDIQCYDKIKTQGKERRKTNTIWYVSRHQVDNSWSQVSESSLARDCPLHLHQSQLQRPFSHVILLVSRFFSLWLESIWMSPYVSCPQCTITVVISSAHASSGVLYFERNYKIFNFCFRVLKPKKTRHVSSNTYLCSLCKILYTLNATHSSL